MKVKGNYCFVCSDGTEFSDMYFASITSQNQKINQNEELNDIKFIKGNGGITTLPTKTLFRELCLTA